MQTYLQRGARSQNHWAYFDRLMHHLFKFGARACFIRKQPSWCHCSTCPQHHQARRAAGHPVARSSRSTPGWRAAGGRNPLSNLASPGQTDKSCRENWKCAARFWSPGREERWRGSVRAAVAQRQGWGGTPVSSGRACGYESRCHKAAWEVTLRPV